MSKCENSKCHIADKLRCHEGYPDPASCPSIIPDSLQVLSIESGGQPNSFLTWTGSVLGMDNIAKFAARSRLATVALIGASDAGKTSFLATLYLMLLRGKTLSGYKFAGSFTLGGWEIIAEKMRWSGSEPPSFPDHTPRGMSRQPGLLHLALKDNCNQLCDVVFADAPGEWFELWATDRYDTQAEGARWLEQHADSVLVFLNSEKLSSKEDQGLARYQTLKLLDRVFSSYSDRSVGIAWSKYDTFQKNQSTEAVMKDIERRGNKESFSIISANHPECKNVIETANWLIQKALEGKEIDAFCIPIVGTNPFINFRGRSE
jgi:Double-GTPase 2